MKPLVSVSVVTYNHKNYIAQCLDGILMQKTSFPFEIILGEDASNDGTRAICKAYAEKFPDKIRLFLRSRKDVIKINGNPTGRFNMLENIKAVKGKYIALCEGDDYWSDPLKLQKQVDFLEANTDYGICFHKISVFNQNKRMLEQDVITRSVPETTTITELAKGNYIHTPSVMLRNDFKIPHWFKKSPLGDWTLYMIAIQDRKIKKLEDVMAVYRQQDNGVWSGKSRKKRMLMTLKSFTLVYENVGLDTVAHENLKREIKQLKAAFKKSYGFKFNLKDKLKKIIYPSYRSIKSLIKSSKD